jgi:hypothetical protein
MNSRELRERIINLNSGTTVDTTALALVYLGDKIEEATGDIGPAIENGLTALSGEIADVSQTMRDSQTATENIASAIQGHATIMDNIENTLRRSLDN